MEDNDGFVCEGMGVPEIAICVFLWGGTILLFIPSPDAGLPILGSWYFLLVALPHPWLNPSGIQCKEGELQPSITASYPWCEVDHRRAEDGSGGSGRDWTTG